MLENANVSMKTIVSDGEGKVSKDKPSLSATSAWNRLRLIPNRNNGSTKAARHRRSNNNDDDDVVACCDADRQQTGGLIYGGEDENEGSGGGESDVGNLFYLLPPEVRWTIWTYALGGNVIHVGQQRVRICRNQCSPTEQYQQWRSTLERQALDGDDTTVDADKGGNTGFNSRDFFLWSDACLTAPRWYRGGDTTTTLNSSDGKGYSKNAKAAVAMTSVYWDERNVHDRLQMLSTCKLIHNEASRAFWITNTFSFGTSEAWVLFTTLMTERDRRPCHISDSSVTTATTVSLITSIQLVSNFGPLWRQNVTPSSVSLFSGLRHLYITVHGSVTGGLYHNSTIGFDRSLFEADTTTAGTATTTATTTATAAAPHRYISKTPIVSIMTWLAPFRHLPIDECTVIILGTGNMDEGSYGAPRQWAKQCLAWSQRLRREVLSTEFVAEDQIESLKLRLARSGDDRLD